MEEKIDKLTETLEASRDYQKHNTRIAMEFNDQLRALSARIQRNIDVIQTEEAAKTAFVMPFIQVLGYDIFDPLEVIPEFIADVGSKKGEKIDYAIMANGESSILIECKTCSCNIGESHASQLRRYFHVTPARIGILTNGHRYMFFSDLDKKNIMDEKPFMEINLLDLDDNLVKELKKLSKSSFELDNMLSAANNLKYIREIKIFFEEQMNNTSSEFVRLVIADIYSGVKTQNIIEQFTPIVKQAIGEIINDKINSRLKSALNRQQSIEEEKEGIKEQDIEDTNQENINDNDRVTISEELEGYYIVRSMLRQKIDINRIFYRKTKRYFGILFDDSNRKPICRLYLNRKEQLIGVFDKDKKETRSPIRGLNDIYDYAEQIQSRTEEYINDTKRWTIGDMAKQTVDDTEKQTVDDTKGWTVGDMAKQAISDTEKQTVDDTEKQTVDDMEKQTINDTEKQIESEPKGNFFFYPSEK